MTDQKARRAAPWKSGASAPRKAPQSTRGFSPWFLIVWDGHSCPSPLTLMLSLILTPTLTLTRKDTAFSRAEKEPPKLTRLQPLRDAAPNDCPPTRPPKSATDGAASS